MLPKQNHNVNRTVFIRQRFTLFINRLPMALIFKLNEVMCSAQTNRDALQVADYRKSLFEKNKNNIEIKTTQVLHGLG